MALQKVDKTTLIYELGSALKRELVWDVHYDNPEQAQNDILY